MRAWFIVFEQMRITLPRSAPVALYGAPVLRAKSTSRIAIIPMSSPSCSPSSVPKGARSTPLHAGPGGPYRRDHRGITSAPPLIPDSGAPEARPRFHGRVPWSGRPARTVAASCWGGAGTAFTIASSLSFECCRGAARRQLTKRSSSCFGAGCASSLFGIRRLRRSPWRRAYSYPEGRPRTRAGRRRGLGAGGVLVSLRRKAPAGHAPLLGRINVSLFAHGLVPARSSSFPVSSKRSCSEPSAGLFLPMAAASRSPDLRLALPRVILSSPSSPFLS